MGINERHIIGGPWVGGVTSSQAIIKVAVEPDVQHVSLVLEKDQIPGAGNTWRQPADVWRDETRAYPNNIYTFVVKDLLPDAKYFYGLVTDGEVEDKSRGKFTTFPPAGDRTSFKFAIGSCSKQPDEEVFGALAKEKDLLFFFHMGDMFYGDLDAAPLHKRLERWDKTMNRFDTGRANTALCNFLKGIPVAYTWDDHDCVKNDSGGAAVQSNGKVVITDNAKTARDGYEIYVPHYEFVDRNVGIFQSFTVGNVLFLLTDLRFNQTPAVGSVKQVLGKDQENWLSTKLDEGKAMDLIVIVSSYPYIINEATGRANWGDYPKEREKLANMIKSKNIRNLCMISGDAHMLAIDDGSNSGYATVINPGQTGKGGFPIFHAAALSNTSSTKGGPYSKGSPQNGGSPGNGIGGPGQYGLFEVRYEDETGTTLNHPQVVWKGRKVKDGVTKDIISHRFGANATYDKF